MDAVWITKAVEAIQNGVADKLEKDNVKIYKVGENLIRIDIKR